MLNKKNHPSSYGVSYWSWRFLLITLVLTSLYLLSYLDYESIKLSTFLQASDTKKVHHHILTSIQQQRNIGYKRLCPNTSYIPLPAPTNVSHPVSVGACCGIGHRLSLNIPTFVHAIHHRRPIFAVWSDVSWNALFNDTAYIKSSTTITSEYYGNGYPSLWLEGIPDHEKGVIKRGTAYDRYTKAPPLLFDMPLAQSIIHSLQKSLSPSVLSFLTSIREQSYLSELHFCAHVREGNNETGDWQSKSWRHMDLLSTLNSTLYSMQGVAKKQNAHNVTVFIASDNVNSRSWFQENVPLDWNVIHPAREVEKPESGVWFGEHGSKTNLVLDQQQKDEAMAEAVSDIFALGECDVLWIPNYSSFTLISIILSRARKRIVKFMHGETLEYFDLSYPEVAQDTPAF